MLCCPLIPKKTLPQTNPKKKKKKNQSNHQSHPKARKPKKTQVGDIGCK
jgi:hypothetical protein